MIALEHICGPGNLEVSQSSLIYSTHIIDELITQCPVVLGTKDGETKSTVPNVRDLEV